MEHLEVVHGHNGKMLALRSSDDVEMRLSSVESDQVRELDQFRRTIRGDSSCLNGFLFPKRLTEDCTT